MKKLLVFFSIFAVLFVSTIRPLQAEQLTDGFRFLPNEEYFLIIDGSQLTANTSILLCADDENEVYIHCVSGTECFLFLNDISNNERIDLIFITSNSDFFEITYYFSFNWFNYETNSMIYDDTYFWFDTENPIPPISIYDTIYSLINKFVFGNSIESGTHQDLTATILSTTICVLVFALPFLIIWKVIKIIMG